MLRIAAAAAATAVVVLLTASLVYVWYGKKGGDQFAQCRQSQVAAGGDTIGGPFTLLNSAGEEVTDQQVITKPSLVYFGYTFCPDICPFDAVRNADAAELLAEDGYDVTPVFISVDPNRDTPEVVGDFAANISDRMIGLTGTPEQVKAASQAYRTYYRSHEGDGDDPYYLVDHSTFTYLVLPEHGFVDFFRRDLTPEQIAATTECFIDAS